MEGLRALPRRGCFPGPKVKLRTPSAMGRFTEFCSFLVTVGGFYWATFSRGITETALYDTMNKLVIHNCRLNRPAPTREVLRTRKGQSSCGESGARPGLER